MKAAENGVAALETDQFALAAAPTSEARPTCSTRRTEHLDQPWIESAAFVPILAQHRDAVVDMSRVGAAGAATVADAVTLIDPADLVVADGRIDVDALAAIEQPLRDVRDGIG